MKQIWGPEVDFVLIITSNVIKKEALQISAGRKMISQIIILGKKATWKLTLTVYQSIFKNKNFKR